MNQFMSLWPQPKFPVIAQSGTVAGASANLTVVPGHTYRVVANTDLYMKLSKGAAAATTSDMFVPSGQVQILNANQWDTINFIQSTAGGKISVVEVLMPL